MSNTDPAAVVAPPADPAAPPADPNAQTPPPADPAAVVDPGTGDPTPPNAEVVYDLKAPAGKEHLLPQRDLDQIKAVATANGWTAEEAQAELDAHVDRVQAAITEHVSALESELKANTTWGGDKLIETQRLAGLAVDKLFPVGHDLRDRFLADLQRSAQHVSLPMVAFMALAGRAFSEDQPPAARAGGGGERSLAERLFPNNPGKK